MISYIFISKQVLQDAGWFIQKSADSYDKYGNEKYKPSVIGYCPVCDAQHTLLYVKQSSDRFIFECLKCKWGF
jgi:hypothetical protein